MSKPVLLDTNVLIYAIDTRSAFHQDSLRFMDTYEGGLYTTSKNLSEYISAGTGGDDPLFSTEEAVQDIEDFANFITILYPDERSLSQLKALLSRYNVRGKRVHDIEIAAIALTNDIEHIATFNTKDFKSLAEISIIQPDKY